MATRELPAPSATKSASDAEEVLRVWIVDRKDLAMTFPPGLYGEDVWKWGRLFAHAARYIAHAHAQETGQSEAEALAVIRLNIDDELASGDSAAGARR